MDVVHFIILKITKNITKRFVSGTKSVPFIGLKTRLITTEMYPDAEKRFVYRVQRLGVGLNFDSEDRQRSFPAKRSVSYYDSERYNLDRADEASGSRQSDLVSKGNVHCSIKYFSMLVTIWLVFTVLCFIANLITVIITRSYEANLPDTIHIQLY